MSKQSTKFHVAQFTLGILCATIIGATVQTQVQYHAKAPSGDSGGMGFATSGDGGGQEYTSRDECIVAKHLLYEHSKVDIRVEYVNQLSYLMKEIRSPAAAKISVIADKDEKKKIMKEANKRYKQAVIDGPKKQLKAAIKELVASHRAELKECDDLPDGTVAADLFVTKDSTPLRVRQLVGGKRGSATLRLQFDAQKASVTVDTIRITSIASEQDNLDKLELYLEGSTDVIAMATKGACGEVDIENDDGELYCASKKSGLFDVPKGQSVDLIVRPLIESDTSGGVSGETIQLQLKDNEDKDTDELVSPVEANVQYTNKQLSQNDGDAIAEGEIFIGVDKPANNTPIVGQRDDIVMSKIISITNANPDENGTVVPTGVAPIGQFKFVADTNDNSENGLNDVLLDTIVFTVNSEKVEFYKDGFYFYDKADSTVKKQCKAYKQNDESSFRAQLVGSTITTTVTSPGGDDGDTGGISQGSVITTSPTGPGEDSGDNGDDDGDDGSGPTVTTTLTSPGGDDGRDDGGDNGDDDDDNDDNNNDDNDDDTTDSTISGNLHVVCGRFSDRDSGLVNTEINEGEDKVFVLEADITNPSVGYRLSSLQVSITDFSRSDLDGVGVEDGQSHILWIDKDQKTQEMFRWIEYPETIIKSTLYQS